VTDLSTRYFQREDTPISKAKVQSPGGESSKRDTYTPTLKRKAAEFHSSITQLKLKYMLNTFPAFCSKDFALAPLVSLDY